MFFLHRSTLSLRKIVKKHFYQFGFSTDVCWKCTDPVLPTDLFCKNTSCSVIQSVDFNNKLDLFKLFDIKKGFNIDGKDLENKFKMLQSKLHPDKFATQTFETREASRKTSSTVNQGYQV